MDSTLRCNDLKCREPCAEQAVVTTCSHIFCVRCAGHLGLIDPGNGQRVCPACHTQLVNPDDAVITNLNPSEDYKTSILSGLSPTVIMECAGRGLAFWAYQMVQEITFQEYLARSLTDKYSILESQRAESERHYKEDNDQLQSSLKSVSEEKQELVNKVERLQHSLQEKTKNMHQVQSLYNKLKSQQQAGTLEIAADQGAEEILMQAGSQQQSQHHISTQRPAGQSQQLHPPRVRGGSNGSGGSDERRQQRTHSWPQGGQQSYSQQNTGATYQPGGSYRDRVSTSHSLPIPPGTSTNRQRLPQAYNRPAFGTYNQSFLGGTQGTGVGNDPLRGGTPLQGRYGTANGPGNSPNNGYGMSAGMRMGRPQGLAPPLSRAGMGTNRPGGGYGGMTMR